MVVPDFPELKPRAQLPQRVLYDIFEICQTIENIGNQIKKFEKNSTTWECWKPLKMQDPASCQVLCTQCVNMKFVDTYVRFESLCVKNNDTKSDKGT